LRHGISAKERGDAAEIRQEVYESAIIEGLIGGFNRPETKPVMAGRSSRQKRRDSGNES
jgi:hypothetical protein